MQVQSVPSWGIALCRASTDGAEPQRIETSLLQHAPHVGDWVLVHVNIALRALEAGEARQISDAVLAQWIERYGAAARDLIASYGRTPGPAPDRPRPHKQE